MSPPLPSPRPHQTNSKHQQIPFLVPSKCNCVALMPVTKYHQDWCNTITRCLISVYSNLQALVEVKTSNYYCHSTFVEEISRQVKQIHKVRKETEAVLREKVKHRREIQQRERLTRSLHFFLSIFPFTFCSFTPLPGNNQFLVCGCPWML